MQNPIIEEFDYIVIGGGSGGIATAKRAALHGKRVLLIEKNHLGGTCVNLGCVPKKILFNASTLVDNILNIYPNYGIELSYKGLDWIRLKKSYTDFINRLRNIYKDGLMKSNITFISGEAKFFTSNTIIVNENYYRGKYICIAVGTSPNIPIQVHNAHLGITSDEFFSLDSIPKKIAIVGAGYIAIEIAGILHSLGSQVSIFVRSDNILKFVDRDISNHLLQSMKSSGILFYFNVKMDRLESIKDKISIHYNDDQQIHGFDKVLWAVGRNPLTDSLNLDHIGVEIDKNGNIVVDKYEETTCKNIYAIGDVIGKVNLTPVAIAAGRLLADRLFSNSKSIMSYENIPTVIFSHPPIGCVGLSESQAISIYGQDKIRVYNSKFSNLFYFPLDPNSKPYSLFKLITVGENERIIGIHGIGMGIDEAIQGFSVGLVNGLTKNQFDSTVAIHPTASEEFVTMHPWKISSYSNKPFPESNFCKFRDLNLCRRSKLFFFPSILFGLSVTFAALIGCKFFKKLWFASSSSP